MRCTHKKKKRRKYWAASICGQKPPDNLQNQLILLTRHQIKYYGEPYDVLRKQKRLQEAAQPWSVLLIDLILFIRGSYEKAFELRSADLAIHHFEFGYLTFENIFPDSEFDTTLLIDVAMLSESFDGNIKGILEYGKRSILRTIPICYSVWSGASPGAYCWDMYRPYRGLCRL